MFKAVKRRVREVNVHEAKTHLSRLLADVERGDEVIIARSGKPIARLVRFERGRSERELGLDRGTVRVGDGFDAPLPEELLKDFER